ncbi:MAG: LamG domain-containing protein, partial [Pseudomonadota bacterium]|nr:LamG domain-containing protein [Pseudomonadota bacterium]
MLTTTIYGYSDRLSVKQGETLRFMVSATGTESVRAQLVRLIHGDENPTGPGFIETLLDSPVNRDWPARHQPTQKGNFLRVADPDGVLHAPGAFTLHAFIRPSTPGVGAQALLGRWAGHRSEGYMLGIDGAGCLELRVGDGRATAQLSLGTPLTAQIWYFIVASFDPAGGQASLHQWPVLNRYNSLPSKIVPQNYEAHAAGTLDVVPDTAEDIGFLIGGANDAVE